MGYTNKRGAPNSASCVKSMVKGAVALNTRSPGNRPGFDYQRNLCATVVVNSSCCCYARPSTKGWSQIAAGARLEGGLDTSSRRPPGRSSVADLDAGPVPNPPVPIPNGGASGPV